MRDLLSLWVEAMLLGATVSVPMTLLRVELLAGLGIALAGPAGPGVAGALTGLGARVETLSEPVGDDEESVGAWARARAPLSALVYDARAPFGDGGPDALRRTMHHAWLAVREVAVGALIDSGDPGKVLLIGPAPDAGPHAEAASAGLENMVRTLSVEWARYGVTTVLIAPGPDAAETELADLVAFLCSPAGHYVSGARVDLGRR